VYATESLRNGEEAAAQLDAELKAQDQDYMVSRAH
jgi:hypothetical protein